MNSIENYIDKRKDLFWSVGAHQKHLISEKLLVETILNYGTMEDVRELIDVLGLHQTAAIFYETTENRTRKNYFPEVENYFKLYFDRHVRQYSVR
jgi:hypothetical protein